MILTSLLAALALSQSPADALLAEAASLGRDLVDGQVCEAVHAGTMQTAFFTTHADTLYTRSQALQLSREAIDDAAEQAYNTRMAEMEAKFAGEPSSEDIAGITANCQSLITTRPEMLGAYQAD